MSSQRASEARSAVVLVSFYELGRPPLALAQAAAFLDRVGVDAALLDLAVTPLGDSLDGGDGLFAAARFVGVSVPMHTALRLALDLLPRLRALLPDAHLCAFGLYAPLCEEILRAAGADSVLGGEHEAALALLARQAIDDAAPRAAATDHAAVVLERLSFPPPARARLAPLERYARFLPTGEASAGRLAAAIEASRGCLHLCAHCPLPPIYGGRFFVVPREVVLEDARRLVAAGARHLSFADPDFLNGPRHAMAIVRALHAEHPEVTFDVTVKVEHLLRHRALLPELGRLGCVFLVSAVESLSDDVLVRLRKGHTRAEAFTALALVEDAGIAFRPTFVPFTPWSTLADYLDLVCFIEDNGLHDRVDPVQLTIRLLVPPGSLLLSQPDTAPAFGALDDRLLSHRWSHPDPRMDRLQREASALVEAAGQKEPPEPPAATFAALRSLAYDLAGDDPPTRSLRPPLAPRPPAPRLSEPWFC